MSCKVSDRRVKQESGSALISVVADLNTLDLGASSCPVSATPTRRISVKFDIRDLCENESRKPKFD